MFVITIPGASGVGADLKNKSMNSSFLTSRTVSSPSLGRESLHGIFLGVRLWCYRLPISPAWICLTTSTCLVNGPKLS